MKKTVQGAEPPELQRLIINWRLGRQRLPNEKTSVLPDIRPRRINPVIRPPIADPAGSPDLKVDPAGLPDFFQFLVIMTFTDRKTSTLA